MKMTENEINTLDKAIEFCCEKSKNIKLKTEPQTFVNITKWLEEFRVLKEKSEPKKPITYTHTHRADCPNCRATVRGIDKPFGDYCSKCGIKLDRE